MGFCNMISFMVQVLTQWAWYKMHVSAFLCEIPLKQESCIIHRFSCMTTYNILFITVYFYICKGDQSMNKDMDQLFPFKKKKRGRRYRPMQLDLGLKGIHLCENKPENMMPLSKWTQSVLGADWGIGAKFNSGKPLFARV